MGKVLYLVTRCHWFRVVDLLLPEPTDFHKTAKPCGRCMRCAEWIEFLHTDAAIDAELREMCLAQLLTPVYSTLPAPATSP